MTGLEFRICSASMNAENNHLRRSKASVILNIYNKRYVVFSVSILLLTQIAIAQQQPPAAPSLVTSPRPLEDASRRLQEKYGKVVTYEEPVLTGEVIYNKLSLVGQAQQRKRLHSDAEFPNAWKAGRADLASILENTIAAYHQQTSETLAFAWIVFEMGLSHCTCTNA